MAVDRRRATGRQGEDLAVSHLRDHGYKIIERNYSCQIGEIDIVAKEAGTIVFVEVRSTTVERFGSAIDSVNLRKQRKLSLLALRYLQEKNLLGQNCRFDVVGVHFSKENTQITLIQNAFEWREAQN
ncbi:MAG: YraN family protein [Deltaproteobacteria bacterium]|nr:YraN family protein [Deltaproteobacteria bacterium]